jgi:protein-L-isoaspartate O-methyltransferase
MFFISKWLNERKLKKKIQGAIRSCQLIFQNVPSYHLAKQARIEQDLFAYQYIYGEIDFQSFAQLLTRCELKPDDIFYDLGSGAGKAVILSSLLHDFKKVCGIERLSLLHESALQATGQLNQKNIHFYCDDILTFDWFDGDIIFVNAATYIGDFWAKVLARLQQLKAGTQIIVVSKQLPSNYFVLHNEDFLSMSWGITRVGIYSRADQSGLS